MAGVGVGSCGVNVVWLLYGVVYGCMYLWYVVLYS